MRRREPTWRVRAREMIREYPALKQELESMRAQSVTASYGGFTGGSNMPKRTVEDIATRELPDDKMRRYNAVRCALDITSNYSNGNLQLEVLRAYYWEDKTMTELSIKHYVSEVRCYQFNDDFIRLVNAFYNRSLKE